MAGLNDDAQWIVLMGFLVSFSFFFLALMINQSTVVGQTTAESVLEFPKNDIRDVRSVMIQSGFSSSNVIQDDITTIALSRKNAVVGYTFPFSHCVPGEAYNCTTIHYNNGMTEYYEDWISP
ncbi:MAG: hypothetical protein WC586_07710 [Methanoregula sp.]